MVMKSELFPMLPLVPDDSPSWAVPAAPWPNLSIGYGHDVVIFREHLHRIMEDTTEQLVLFGFSRGTATVLNTLAAAQPNAGRIKGVILLGAFASAQDVIAFRRKERWLWACLWPIVAFIQEKMYGPAALDPANAPITNVAHIPSGIPIYIVASQGDRDVPYTSAVKLHAALCAAGKNAALITLKNTPHEMATATGEDRATLERVFAEVYA
jgi:hypothetical protein